MNSRLPLIVFNGFIKPDVLEQLIEYGVSMVERKKLKAGLYHFYDFILYKTQVVHQKACARSKYYMTCFI